MMEISTKLRTNEILKVQSIIEKARLSLSTCFDQAKDLLGSSNDDKLPKTSLKNFYNKFLKLQKTMDGLMDSLTELHIPTKKFKAYLVNVKASILSNKFSSKAAEFKMSFFDYLSQLDESIRIIQWKLELDSSGGMQQERKVSEPLKSCMRASKSQELQLKSLKKSDSLLNSLNLEGEEKLIPFHFTKAFIEVGDIIRRLDEVSIQNEQELVELARDRFPTLHNPQDYVILLKDPDTEVFFQLEDYTEISSIRVPHFRLQQSESSVEAKLDLILAQMSNVGVNRPERYSPTDDEAHSPAGRETYSPIEIGNMSTKNNTEDAIARLHAVSTGLATLEETFKGHEKATKMALDKAKHQVALHLALSRVPATEKVQDSSSETAFNRANEMYLKLEERLRLMQGYIEQYRLDVTERSCRPQQEKMERWSQKIDVFEASIDRFRRLKEENAPAWKAAWEVALERVLRERGSLKMHSSLIETATVEIDRMREITSSIRTLIQLKERIGNTPFRSPSTDVFTGEEVVNGEEGLDGVVEELKYIAPDSELRLAAIAESERIRQLQLQVEQENEFQEELETVVEERAMRPQRAIDAVEARLREKTAEWLKNSYQTADTPRDPSITMSEEMLSTV